jgi:rhodanese-related sulfurtransferase
MGMSETLIDVRELHEFDAGHIPGAKHVPLGTIRQASQPWDKGQPLMLVCKSGRRAEKARQLLAAEGFTTLVVLPGGMDAWSGAGQFAEAAERQSPRQSWSMERQVRTAAGSLVLATLVPGALVSPYFLLGTTLIGAGLVYAGVSDTCMMAHALARMPWNHRPARA